MKITISYIFIFLLLPSSILFGQSYEQLVQKKNHLLRQSEHLNKTLSQIKSNEQHTIEALNLINSKIDVQSDLLDVLKKKIKKLKLEEKELEKEIAEIFRELQLIKENYAYLIQITHQSTRNYNRILFFLSSNNFNQLMRRLYHFRQLELNRRNKYTEIQILQKELKNKKKLVVEKKIEQADLAILKKTEVLDLKKSKASKQQTISVLKSKSDSLSNALKKQEIEKQEIEKQILEIIQNRKGVSKNLTPELKLISNKFSANKGRLPWPVNSGSVVTKFGKSQHPVLSGISIMNNGIEISTHEDKVRSVFQGEVTKIIILPTGLKVVIIRHGEYLTVYSNLSKISVKKGEKINTKDYIGTLYSDKDQKNNTLGFQIWKDRDKLNPMSWISSY